VAQEKKNCKGKCGVAAKRFSTSMSVVRNKKFDKKISSKSFSNDNLNIAISILNF